MAEIKAGDVVQLKSGGPRMTVAEVEMWNGKPRAECTWFTGNKNESSLFPLESLKLADEKETGPTVPAIRVGKTAWS